MGELKNIPYSGTSVEQVFEKIIAEMPEHARELKEFGAWLRNQIP
jgi:hypothetical protein